MSDAGAMSSEFRPWCHLEFVPAVLWSKWMRRRTTRPFDGIIADAARPSLIETLTSGRSVVYNNIDKYAAPTSRRFQSGGPARSRCAPSASAERARRGLWRHGGVLRPSRPRTGQVRDAPTTLGRGAGGEPRGRRLRHQPTSVLYGRSGFPGAGNSWPTAASTGAGRNHKCTDEVLDFVERWRSEHGIQEQASLLEAVRRRFGATIHPRSLDRALARRKKKLTTTTGRGSA